MKNLSISEKIALIWTIPIVLLIIVGAAIYSVLKFTFAVVFVKSGTAGSMSFIFLKIKSSFITKQFDKFRREDSILANFDIRN